MQINIPFKHISKRIIIELLKFLVMWINASPVKSGLSTNFSPRTVINVTAMYWQNHCKEYFGS